MNKQTFPVINTLDEFRANVSHRDEIREISISDDSVSFCYVIAGDSTFDTEWLRECRGIVFSKRTGQVTGRPLHKFFNVGEREETRIENLDWTKVKRVTPKYDGSMIHTVFDDGQVRFKSKRTFDSDVAKAAEKWMQANPNYIAFCEYLSGLNLTAIFEWTAPDARIVLFYPEPQLTLLHVRSNFTGEYLSPVIMEKWAADHGVKTVESQTLVQWLGFRDEHDISEKEVRTRITNLVQTTTDVEGWVVQFEDDTMVKLKTDWYLKRHRAMTFVRERDIAQLVLDEGLDDMKSLLVGEGVDISEILSIEQRVLRDLRELAHSVLSVFEADKHMDRKEFALKHKDHQHFGLLMSQYTGKEPDFKGYFERHMLRERYTLRQLVLMQSVAEVE
jgi:RNA ligase